MTTTIEALELGLAGALVRAQAEMPSVPKTATNPHYRSKFAPLDVIIEQTRPVLAKYGLAVLQMPTTINGEPALRTILLHESGERIEDVMLTLPSKPDPQGQGAALTYARRYAYTSVLRLAADDDDDGNAASQVQRPAGRDPGVSETSPRLITDSQRRGLMALIKELGVPLSEARQVIAVSTGGVLSTKLIPADALQAVRGDLSGYAQNPEAGQGIIMEWREAHPELAHALDEKLSEGGGSDA